MQVIVIINASAGTVVSTGADAWSAPAVEQAFTEGGLYPDINYVEPNQIGRALRDAAARRPDAIVVGGGDGTLNAAAGIMADTGIPLGILPLGTLNHFSKDLKIPMGLAEAVSVVAGAKFAAVDLAEVNGRVFINNCSIGAYPDAVRRRDALREQRGHGKWRAMTLAWIDVLKNLRRLRLELTVDGARRSLRTPMLLVSNNRYSGGLFSQNLREHLDAGELWLYTTRAYRLFPLFRLALRAALGRLQAAEHFETWPARAAEVNATAKTLAVGLDGEVAELETPLRFRIRPRALLVCAPPVSAAVGSR